MLATPPAILAVHKPARHAIARVLHRAAERLDDRPVVAAPQFAALPCAPILAGGDGAGGPDGLGGFAPGGLPLPDTSLASSVPGGGGFFGFGFGGGGFGGGGFGGGGGGGGPSGSAPGLPGPGSGGTSNGTVPEPAAWALMITGFGAVGAIARYRRPVAAA